ncbi:MAG: hypothetical protein LBL45_08665 [Treponema sp.]|jgi:hypothetical protein|nr:hypothetical protein [Treponema sp.]
MKIADLLAIVGILVFWYGVAPLAGICMRRWRRKVFRQRFKEVLRKPLLDYETWRLLEREGLQDTQRRFSGKIEATSDNMLWVKSDSLLIPVELRNAKLFFINNNSLRHILRRSLPDFSGFSEDMKIFVAGEIVQRHNRRIFASTRKNPLIAVLYDTEEEDLVLRIIRASRNKNDYWNVITPYAIFIGAFSLIITAVSFLRHPALWLTVITAFIAVFIPLFPFFPLGVLFTALGRFLRKQSETASISSDMLAIREPRNRRQARYYSLKAAICEAGAVICVIMGIGANVFFVGAIVLLFIRGWG